MLILSSLNRMRISCNLWALTIGQAERMADQWSLTGVLELMKILETKITPNNVQVKQGVVVYLLQQRLVRAVSMATEHKI